MILFLDFDGVLHPEPCYREEELLCRRPLFESVMREFPCVEIVVSSTWRDSRSLAQLKALFSDDIARRIIGVTPNVRDLQDLQDSVGQYPRHVEVEGWLRQADRAWEAWVAIDDRPYWFRPFLPNLVRCWPKIGMDNAVAVDLRTKLRGFA